MVFRCGIVPVVVLVLGACDSDSSGGGDDGASGGGASAATGGGVTLGDAGGTSQGGRAGGGTGGGGAGGSSQCDGRNDTFTPAAEEAHDAYCATRAAHVAACGTPDDDPTCPEVSCVERVYDSERFVDYVACQAQKSCEAFLATDDDCFESAGGPLTAEMLAFVGYCEDRLEECAPSFSDDLCAVVSPLIRRSIFCGVDACLRGPCDAVPACLELAPAAIPDCW